MLYCIFGGIPLVLTAEVPSSIVAVEGTTESVCVTITDVPAGGSSLTFDITPTITDELTTSEFVLYTVWVELLAGIRIA